MPTLRAIILDFDGLILETEGACFASWQEVFAAHGHRYELAEYLKIVGTHHGVWDPRAVLDRLCGGALDWARLEPGRRARELELGSALTVQPGVEELLRGARARGLRAAVASSSSHEWVDAHLERKGLRGYFDTTVCRGDAPEVKPAPDLYLEALRRLGVEARETVAFEDSHNGSLAAKRAGLWCVAVPTPVTATQDFSHVDLLVPTLAGLDLDTLLVRFLV